MILNTICSKTLLYLYVIMFLNKSGLVKKYLDNNDIQRYKHQNITISQPNIEIIVLQLKESRECEENLKRNKSVSDFEDVLFVTYIKMVQMTR